MGRLEGKVCLITGSGGAMGRAASLMFAREGARLVGYDLKPEAAAETVAQVGALGAEMASLQPCDLTDSGDCARLAELAVGRFGGLDVLLNNAARAYFGWLDDHPPVDFWRKAMEEDFGLVFLMSRAAWPVLCKRGHHHQHRFDGRLDRLPRPGRRRA